MRRAMLVLLGLTMIVGSGVLVWHAVPRSETQTGLPSVSESVSGQRARQLAKENPSRNQGIDTDQFGQSWSEHVRTSPPDAAERAEAAKGPSLSIPSVYVSAPVATESVVVDDGAKVMSLPHNLSDVGWLNTTAPLSSNTGTTLLAGHVTYGGSEGALYLLTQVRPGDVVTTVDDQGQSTEWVVTSVKPYRKDSLPVDLFDADGPRRLAVVTCSGTLVQQEDGSYSHRDNTIVSAVPR